MASFRKLPSGSWQCRIHVGEGEYKSFTGRTKREAELKSAEYLTQKPTARMIQDGDVTVGVLLYRYINARKGSMSSTTYLSYKSIADHYFSDLKQKTPSNLSKIDVQSTVSDMAARLSPKTVRNAYTLLQAAIAEYTPNAFEDILLPAKDPKPIDIPSSADVKAILDYFRGTRYELPFYVAAFCGLRRGELCALTYGDFDKRTRTIRVDKSMCVKDGGGCIIKGTKTEKSVRSVFAPSSVFDLVPDDKDPSARIVDVYICTLYDALHKAQVALHIKPFRFHDFRHYACSLMISLGYPYTYIKDQLGHSSERMIKQVYGHVMIEKKAVLFASMDEEVGKIMG